MLLCRGAFWQRRLGAFTPSGHALVAAQDLLQICLADAGFGRACHAYLLLCTCTRHPACTLPAL